MIGLRGKESIDEMNNRWAAQGRRAFVVMEEDDDEQRGEGSQRRVEQLPRDNQDDGE